MRSLLMFTGLAGEAKIEASWRLSKYLSKHDIDCRLPLPSWLNLVIIRCSHANRSPTLYPRLRVLLLEEDLLPKQ